MQTGKLQEIPTGFGLQSRKKKELPKLRAWCGSLAVFFPLVLCPSPQTVLRGSSSNRSQHGDIRENPSLLGGARAQRL